MTKVLTTRQAIYAPRFFLEANGELATDIIPLIHKFEYDDNEKKIDQLHIQVLNPGLRFKDDPRFTEGARYRVRFGYDSDYSDVKNAVISKARPHYANGIPIIDMVAFGLQQDMHKSGNPFNYGPSASSTIAKVIAERYNFDTDIEESLDARRQHRIQPAGVTDIQYLISLANKLNWDCYIEGSVLHFHHKRMDQPAVAEFTYYIDGLGTLLKFEPDINMNKFPGTKQTGADTKTGNSSSQGRTDDNQRMFNFTQANVGSLTPGRKFTVGGVVPKSHLGAGVNTPSHEHDAKVIGIHGAAQAQKIDMNAVKAHVEVIGTPRLRARRMIRIIGVDHQYSGNWRVTSSKHSLDPKGVYKVTAKLIKDAGKAKSKDQNTKGGDAKEKAKVHYITSNGARVVGRSSSP